MSTPPALTAARVLAAVSARVARARSHHAAAALGALDCVFPRVEERRLARGRCRGVVPGPRGHGAAVLVRLGQPPADFLAQDARLLLLVGGEELPAESAAGV